MRSFPDPTSPSSSSCSTLLLRPRVAIVGGGAAGLAAARAFRHWQPTVFETRSELGGVWNYYDCQKEKDEGSSTCTTKKKNHPMYRGLRTNLPKELMEFYELPFTITDESENETENAPSFVTHDVVLAYLQRYASTFDLIPFVQFNTTVEHIRILPATTTSTSSSSSSSFSRFGPDWPHFQITYSSSSTVSSTTSTSTLTNTDITTTTTDQTNTTTTSNNTSSRRSTTTSTTTARSRTTVEVFDAVCICNGHYSRPSIPDLPGMQEAQAAIDIAEAQAKAQVEAEATKTEATEPSRLRALLYGMEMMHAIEYDTPETFKGKRVLCVGARASGSDIARELTRHAAHVFVSDSTYAHNEPLHTSWGVTVVPRTIRILPNQTVECAAKTTASTTTTIPPRNDHHHSPPPLTIQVDTILFCTGYEYHFPFLQQSSSSSTHDFEWSVQVGARKVGVQPLIAQLWHAHIPNLAWIGLPHSVVPFPLMELQAQCCLHQWMHVHAANNNNNSNNKDKPQQTLQHHLPPFEFDHNNKNNNNNKNDDDDDDDDAHYLGDAQWSYCQALAQTYAPTLWTRAYQQFILTNQTMYNHVSALRTRHSLGAIPDHYRSYRYSRNDTQGVITVTYPSSSSREQEQRVLHRDDFC